jgi:hypothetical protein
MKVLHLKNGPSHSCEAVPLATRSLNSSFRGISLIFVLCTERNNILGDSDTFCFLSVQGVILFS